MELKGTQAKESRRVCVERGNVNGIKRGIGEGAKEGVWRQGVQMELKGT